MAHDAAARRFCTLALQRSIHCGRFDAFHAFDTFGEDNDPNDEHDLGA